MRKFVCAILAVAMTAMPLSTSFATYVHKMKTPPIQHQSNNTTGQWAVGCGFAAAGSLMIGTAIHAGDKNDLRQLTINEAAWHSAACPFLLPWALLVQATCPDNKATYRVARLAFRFLLKHPSSDQSAFTNAYGEACRTGTLSRTTARLLNHLIGA